MLNIRFSKSYLVQVRAVLGISSLLLIGEIGSQKCTLVEGFEGLLRSLGTLQFQTNVHLEAVPKRF